MRLITLILFVAVLTATARPAFAEAGLIALTDEAAVIAFEEAGRIGIFNVPLGPPPAIPSPNISGGMAVVLLMAAYAAELEIELLYYQSLSDPQNAIDGSIGQPANNPTDYESDYWKQFWWYYGGAAG